MAMQISDHIDEIIQSVQLLLNLDDILLTPHEKSSLFYIHINAERFLETLSEFHNTSAQKINAWAHDELNHFLDAINNYAEHLLRIDNLHDRIREQVTQIKNTGSRIHDLITQSVRITQSIRVIA